MHVAQQRPNASPIVGDTQAPSSNRQRNMVPIVPSGGTSSADAHARERGIINSVAMMRLHLKHTNFLRPYCALDSLDHRFYRIIL